MIQNEYNIEPATIYAIGQFSILWCHFEQSYFSSHLQINKLVEWATLHNDKFISNKLVSEIREVAVSYLGTVDKQTIIRRIYSGVNGGSKDLRKYIQDYFDDSGDKEFVGCMLFILRIRNNLFHGIKSIYDLNEQREIFESINALMFHLLKKDEWL